MNTHRLSSNLVVDLLLPAPHGGLVYFDPATKQKEALPFPTKPRQFFYGSADGHGWEAFFTGFPARINLEKMSEQMREAFFTAVTENLDPVAQNPRMGKAHPSR